MAIFKMIDENTAAGKVKEVFDDIKSSRGITEIPNFWKMLANDPNELERSWNSLKQVMRKGALDPITKELMKIRDTLYDAYRDLMIGKGDKSFSNFECLIISSSTVFCGIILAIF